MQLYAITDRRLFASREALLDRVTLWAGGVDFIQIREKDLGVTELTALAAEIVGIIRKAGAHTRVLLNGPAEAAAEAGCAGVHLPSTAPADAIAATRHAWRDVPGAPVISISCHTVAEIECARDQGATLALFAPVFEKRLGAEIVPGQGLAALADACRMGAPMPVFALGGVTTQNAKDCLAAEAAGIAAIRLFASGDWCDLR